MKLPASALFFAITIALVIALLCSSLIFSAYHQRLQVHQQQLKEKVLRNARSGTALLLANASLGLDTSMTLDLFSKGQDSVHLRTTNWGLLQAGHVRAFSGKTSVSRSFLLGTESDSLWKGALYLADQGRPVSLAGRTLIKGKVWLPEAGAQRGNVGGKNFEFEQLIQGTVRKSRNQLPELQPAFLKQLLRQVNPKQGKPAVSEMLLLQDSLVVAFADPLCRIHSGERPLTLGDLRIKGNVLLSSDTLIQVASHTQLENVILVAPVIKFAEGFKGRVQAFATDSIVTGRDCHFRYPSALGLLETDSVDNAPRILLSEKCLLDGMLFLYVHFVDRSRASVTIQKGATVRGQVYAQGMTILEGKIEGSLVCEKFWLQTPSIAFENHLLDAVIDRSRLSRHFLGSPLFSDHTRKIALWTE